MGKKHKEGGRKEYEKPKVTVIKLQIEERLMSCRKYQTGPTCAGNKSAS